MTERVLSFVLGELIDYVYSLLIKMPFYVTFFYTQIPIYIQIYSLHMYEDMDRTNER